MAAVSCLPDLSHAELVAEWREIEERSHIFEMLKNARAAEINTHLTGFVLLINSQKELTIETRETYRAAVELLLELEQAHPEWDIVLVAGSGDEAVRSAFRNYFRDAKQFVEIVKSAIEE